MTLPPGARVSGDSGPPSAAQQQVPPGSATHQPRSYKPLSADEKRYLVAVERGDLSTIRKYLESRTASDQTSSPPVDFNKNCTDPFGRSALLIAIDNENIEMVELLIQSGVELRDALLHAINEEFAEAVEMLLDREFELQAAMPGRPWVSLLDLDLYAEHV